MRKHFRIISCCNLREQKENIIRIRKRLSVDDDDLCRIRRSGSNFLELLVFVVFPHHLFFLEISWQIVEFLFNFFSTQKLKLLIFCSFILITNHYYCHWEKKKQTTNDFVCLNRFFFLLFFIYIFLLFLNIDISLFFFFSFFLNNRNETFVRYYCSVKQLRVKIKACVRRETAN